MNNEEQSPLVAGLICLKSYTIFTGGDLLTFNSVSSFLQKAIFC
jgi:hypothetical protein